MTGSPATSCATGAVALCQPTAAASVGQRSSTDSFAAGSTANDAQSCSNVLADEMAALCGPRCFLISGASDPALRQLRY